jgi:hypothetical protein
MHTVEDDDSGVVASNLTTQYLTAAMIASSMHMHIYITTYVPCVRVTIVRV